MYSDLTALNLNRKIHSYVMEKNVDLNLKIFTCVDAMNVHIKPLLSVMLQFTNSTTTCISCLLYTRIRPRHVCMVPQLCEHSI